MRPRRGFDRPPETPSTRINEAIRVPQVRLIDDDGSQIGLKGRDEALEYAWAKNLDLVEVAPDARPPVCRVMDYSKYRYEQEQKAKLARKHQSTITIKEIKLRPKVGDHDYQTKKGHVVRFLNNRDKVKVTIMFRGREMTHPERGRALLLRLAQDVKELAVIESEPLQDGRNMVMMLAPIKPREPQPEPTLRRSPGDLDEAAANGDSGAPPEGAAPPEAAAPTEAAAPEDAAATESAAPPEATAAPEAAPARPARARTKAAAPAATTDDTAPAEAESDSTAEAAPAPAAAADPAPTD